MPAIQSSVSLVRISNRSRQESERIPFCVSFSADMLFALVSSWRLGKVSMPRAHFCRFRGCAFTGPPTRLLPGFCVRAKSFRQTTTTSRC
jgi:hypothetical protein